MIDLDFDIDSIIETISEKTLVLEPRQKPPSWNADEIAYLHKYAGILDDQEIGDALGRTANAVKVFRVRAKILSVSRQATTWITANKAARLLGIDSHKIVHWCRVGLIPARFKVHAPSEREYILINREMLKRWCVNLRNWPYFDWRLIKDPHIRRLCELRAQRWGDEWWDTTQVATYHGVDVGDVKRLIARGEIKSYRPEHSMGGRDFGNAWRCHFVLKSEATRADLVFHKRKGMPGVSRKFSPAFDAFLLKARHELKLEWEVIGRMMKTPRKSCQYRYWRLDKKK